MKQRLRTLCNLSVTSVCSQRYHKVLVSVTAMWERASWLFITFVYRTRCRKMWTWLDRTIVKYYFWHSHNRTAFTTLTTVCSLDLSWTEACIKPILACLNVCHIPSTFVLSFFMSNNECAEACIKSIFACHIMFVLHYRPSFSHSVFHDPQWDTTIKVQLNVQFAAHDQRCLVARKKISFSVEDIQG